MVTDTFDFKINGINQSMYYTPNDRDFFKFCPDNCGNVNFKVIAIPQGFNIGARVYSDTTDITEPMVAQVLATGLNPLNLNFPVVAGQCYYVMVYENGDNATSSQAMTAQVSFTPSTTLPIAMFTANANGATVIFSNTSSNATTYQWNFGDGSPPSNEEDPVHTYTLPGTYTITLTANGPCGQNVYTFDVTVNFVGIDEEENAKVHIYPNPSNGFFTIETSEQGNHKYQVYDQMGKLVLSGTNASQRFVLDLSHLPDGNYVLKMNDTTQVLTKMK